MFNSISVKNFRGIQDLKIDDLSKINLFVGDNATGKTTILDAVYILINPGNPELPLKINDWRDLGPFTPIFWRSLFYNFEHKNEITLTAEGAKAKRTVHMKPKTSVTRVIATDSKPNGELKAGSEIERALDGLELTFQIDKQKYTSSIEQAAVNQVKLNPSTNYKEDLQGHYLNNKTYSEDLASKFDQVNQEVGKEHLIGFLRKFKANIEDIELDSFRKLLVKDTAFGTRRVHLNTYGDGMIRGLHIILDILSKKDGITLIDEIENGLHWSKQEIVWQFIYQIVKERQQQLFITTHSREMIHHLYTVAKNENCADLLRVYRLQHVGNAIKAVGYKPNQLAFALTHDEEFR